MITILYFLTFLASVIMSGSCLIKSRRIDRDYVLFGIVISLHTLGGWLVAQSDTVEEAILATKQNHSGTGTGSPSAQFYWWEVSRSLSWSSTFLPGSATL